MLFFAFFLVTKGSDGEYAPHIYEWAASFPLFRFLLIIVFIVGATAFDMRVLKANKVNFQYIFDLDPNYRLTYIQLARVTTVLFAIWFFCFTGNLIETHLNYLFDKPVSYFSIIVLVVFCCICFLPLHCFYEKARWSLGKTLFNIVISPFGLVRFRHFFLADVITSMVTPLKDTGMVICFFATKDWEEGKLPD